MNDAEIGKVIRREPDAWARAVQDHLAIKTETGPISGCQCGQLRLGESYTEHLRAALPAPHGAAPTEWTTAEIEVAARATLATWGLPWDWEEADELERQGARVQAQAALAAIAAHRASGRSS